MGLVRKIALVVLLISFIVFVALFGRLPALRSTPIGALHRLLLYRIPAIIRQVDEGLSGGRLTSAASRTGHLLFNEAHNVVLIAFLALLTSAVSVFLYTAWSMIPTWPHHVLIPPVVIAPYIFTYLSSVSTVSQIKANNHAANLQLYPYDHVLYHPGITCTTCNFDKPARSKHCSLCRSCISRHDHHCVWINNCVGLSNYKWFMSLLLSLGVVPTYGACLAWGILSKSPAWGRMGLGWFDKFSLSINTNINVGAVALLAALTAPLAWGLFAYHAYLIWAGMTTNETAKWKGLEEDISEGNAWTGTLRHQNNVDTQTQSNWPKDNDKIVVLPADGKHPSALWLEHVDQESWTELGSLADVDNIYDNGFWWNMQDALAIRH